LFSNTESQLLKSNIFSTIGMTVHREVFGVKFAQASLEQILPHPSQQKPVIPYSMINPRKNLFF
jgi:hypothetical protein